MTQFENQQPVLLNGVTSSGKTEIYIRLIEEQLKQGKQVLYFVPEIGLTTQIITRLKTAFGDLAGIYHSKFNDAERVEIWFNVLNEKSGKTGQQYQVILGARSAIFLPFRNLGLIIVDEEHTAPRVAISLSYKSPPLQTVAVVVEFYSSKLP